MEGVYTNRLYVVIDDEKSQEELERRGSYGDNLEDIRRRGGSCIGPASRQILDLNLVQANDSNSPALLLTLPEAFFLSHALKCLKVTGLNISKDIDLDYMWITFRSDYNRSNKVHDFALEYGVYHYFRTRGWIVKSGTNYGADFLLYNIGPKTDHARYAAVIVSEVGDSDRCSLTWHSILTFHRVAQSVCKELLLVFVTLAENSANAFEKPDVCIKKMQILTRVFSCISKTSKLL